MRDKYLYSVLLFFFFGVIKFGLINIGWTEYSYDPLCGPKSLYNICKKFRVSTTIEELCNLSDYNEQYGTTMLGIYNAALKKNLPVVPVKVDIDQFCSFKSPSIAFIDGNHFLVVHSCKKDNVIIQNPPDKPIEISKKDFQKRWNGEALIFSEKLKKQLASQIEKVAVPFKGPHIHFYETNYNFGVVNESDVLSHKFKFKNIGTDTLNVSVRSTCSCTAAVLSDKNIPPGDSGEILMEYNTNGRKGLTKQSVDVRTNNPEKGWVSLTMSATVRTSINVVPGRLWLDKVAIGEEVNREILVIDPGDGALKVESVDVPEGITAEILPIKNDSTSFRAVPINLSIRSENRTGDFEKLVTIHTNDPRRSEIVVPISGIVMGKLKAFPPVIFYGEIKQDTTVVREITLSSTNGENMEITKVASTLSYVSTEVKTIEDGSKFKLIATLQAPSTATTVRDNIPIYINGNEKPAIEIPLYARVIGN